MKRKVKLKLPFYILVLSFVPILILSAFLSIKNTKTNLKKEPEETIINSYPVINEDDGKISLPYTNDSVKVGKKYYDYKSEESNQENSIVVHDNTYYQNTGIDYVAEKPFDVLAIDNGTVTNVKEDDNLGKIVEIKHENGLISSYQSLSEILVKKNDVITKGQLIGKSGTNELDKELENHLHLEIYENGQAVNPENYLGKVYEKKN